MKNLMIIVLLLALLALPGVALAQDYPMVEPALPDWAETLAFGTVALSAFVWAATELTKRALGLFGWLRDDWGRYIAVVWSIVMVGVALGAEMLEFDSAPVVEWVYQAMLLVLTLLGAPVIHQIAKTSGLTKKTE